MNLFYNAVIKQCSDKMSGYLTLMNYRYMNLCVKAEPASLMPVTISFFGEEKNIEDVAQVGQPDDYHLAVIPQSKEMIDLIAQNIFLAHPEFKLSRKTIEAGGDNIDYLEYEMPEVDKNRRDFLSQAVKGLHEEAKARIDAVHADQKRGLAEFIREPSADLDEANNELDKVHEDYVTQIRDIRDDKLQEIEDGYMHYLSQNAKDNAADGNQTFDVTQSMIMSE